MPTATPALKVVALGSPRQNHLLAALEDADYQRLAPDLEFVRLPLGRVVCESGTRLTHVYFPTTSLVSMHYLFESGSSVEFAVTGNEGVVGISLFMGGEMSAGRAVVRTAGHAYRLRAEVLTREFERGGSLRHLLLRYTHALFTQMAQTAVCNRCHQTEQQLCRTLLFSLDRLPTNEIVMTHELIAHALGVRRESVTAAAGKLQAAGLIRCNRGRITVLNRLKLESRVCECYAVVKDAFERVLPPRDAVRRIAPGPAFHARSRTGDPARGPAREERAVGLA